MEEFVTIHYTPAGANYFLAPDNEVMRGHREGGCPTHEEEFKIDIIFRDIVNSFLEGTHIGLEPYHNFSF